MPIDAGKRADKDERHQPRRNVTDPQRAIKRRPRCSWPSGVKKDFRDPRHQDENENENVITFQPAADRFQFADLEARQNQIFANQFFPFALEQVAILHHHRHEKMRFQHSDARAKRIVKPVTARFDPEHHPDDREIEKENDVRHLATRKRDRNNGGAAGDGPVGRDVEPLPPDHDAPELAAIEMRHGIDVARVVKAALQRNSRFLGWRRDAVFSCHGYFD